MEQPGVHAITLILPPVEGEATADNNRVRRWVKVLPEKIRVAAFAGSGGWDFQYLRATLGRTPWVSLESGVLDPASPKLPLTPEQILKQDVLVLSDVPVDALDRDQWYAVDRLTTRRAGAWSSSPAAETRWPATPRQPLAAGLLPYAPSAKLAWQVWPGERPNFRLVPAARERARPSVLRLEDGDAGNRRWQELPALYRIMPVPEASSAPACGRCWWRPSRTPRCCRKCDRASAGRSASAPTRRGGGG